MMASATFVVVVDPTFPAETLPEFIAYAKADPDKIDMASNGTVTHMAGALFMATTGVDLVHVPYSGSFFSDLLSGKMQVAFIPLAGAIGYIRAGTLRPLAVTGATRSTMLPQLPAMAEFVSGYEANLWDGIGVPRNTAPEIIDKLNKEINAVLADPKMTTRMADLGAVPMPMTVAEFGKHVASETEKWAKVIRAANIKVE
jgi:tripartite-type tricarboxylate transporter receptor subunit TctC